MSDEQLPPLDTQDPQVRARHLLALPGGIGADEVEVLAQSRFTAARWEEPTDTGATRTGLRPAVTAAFGIRAVPAGAQPAHALRLGRMSRLVGPYSVTPEDAMALRLPATTRTVWALDCPAERGEPPWPGGDRDGLKRAFPKGVPVRDEERALVWLVATARRLQGAVRIADSGVVLTPDVDQAIDLTVLTDRWLEPDEAVAVVRRVLPRAHRSGEGVHQPWSGPPHPDDPAVRAALGPFGVQDAAERARLSAEADAYDQWMMAHPPAAEAFGVEADLGVDGILVVEVSERQEVPPLLRSLPWAANGVVAYRVHWEPSDVTELEAERPSLEHRVARGRTSPRIQAIAKALHEAVGGEVADEADFLVDPADL